MNLKERLCAMWRNWGIRIGVAVACVVLLSGVSRTHGDSAPHRDIVWAAPINLSNTPQLSTHPAIVADDFGYVHVFWSEEMGGRVRESGDIGGEGNTILHTRWDGVGWTLPVDVLFAPDEFIAEFIDVDLGPDNWLHIVWTGQDNFYYSSAPSWKAESAHAWQTPIVIASASARTAYESDILVDAASIIHVAYATRGDDAGIYYTRSEDAGASWTSPRRLSEPFQLLERSFSHVQLTADMAGNLHIVWQTSQHEGFGQAIYYVRSENNGTSWSAPWQFGYRDPGDIFVEWPYLFVRDATELHLIYVDGSVRGRFQRISVDDGETWSDPAPIIPELEGINGYVFPVVDGAGGMHLIANMRTVADQLVGVYYASWNGIGWSPTEPLDNTSVAAPSAHHTSAAVRLGNEIYVVYNQISVGEIWLLQGTLSSIKPVAPRALPQAGTTPSPTLDVTATPTTPAFASQPGPSSAAWASQAPAAASDAGAVILGIAASALLVGGALVWTRIARGKSTIVKRKP